MASHIFDEVKLAETAQRISKNDAPHLRFFSSTTLVVMKLPTEAEYSIQRAQRDHEDVCPLPRRLFLRWPRAATCSGRLVPPGKELVMCKKLAEPEAPTTPTARYHVIICDSSGFFDV